MDPMSSAADPIFFPLHATFERVWQYMRVDKEMESTWTGHGNNDDDADDTSDMHYNPVGWLIDDPQYPFKVGGVQASLSTSTTTSLHPPPTSIATFIADTTFIILKSPLSRT
jgi:hypothetical protein